MGYFTVWWPAVLGYLAFQEATAALPKACTHMSSGQNSLHEDRICFLYHTLQRGHYMLPMYHTLTRSFGAGSHRPLWANLSRPLRLPAAASWRPSAAAGPAPGGAGTPPRRQTGGEGRLACPGGFRMHPESQVAQKSSPPDHKVAHNLNCKQTSS